MLLSGNLKPPTMMVPLLVVPPPVVPPHAATIVATTARAAISHTDARVRLIKNRPGPGGPPRSNSRCVTILPLGDLERGRWGGHGGVQQPDAARHEPPLNPCERELCGQGKYRNQQRARRRLDVVLGGQPVNDVPAETTPGDERRQRRRRNDLDRRCSVASHDQRYREGQLDPQDLGRPRLA